MNAFTGIVFNALISMSLAVMFSLAVPTAPIWMFVVLGFGVALARILGILESGKGQTKSE